MLTVASHMTSGYSGFTGSPELVDRDGKSYFLPAAGDVVAALQIACNITAHTDVFAPDAARLILTAAVLHCGARNDLVEAADLANLLTRLAKADSPPHELLSSPMQFVRYAVLDLFARSPENRRRIVEGLQGAVSRSLC